jgi:hypothetical protein
MHTNIHDLIVPWYCNTCVDDNVTMRIGCIIPLQALVAGYKVNFLHSGSTRRQDKKMTTLFWAIIFNITLYNGRDGNQTGAERGLGWLSKHRACSFFVAFKPPRVSNIPSKLVTQYPLTLHYFNNTTRKSKDFILYETVIGNTFVEIIYGLGKDCGVIQQLSLMTFPSYCDWFNRKCTVVIFVTLYSK